MVRLWRFRPGFRGVARSESKDKNLGGPLVSLQGREGYSNPQEGVPERQRESDCLIVL